MGKTILLACLFCRISIDANSNNGCSGIYLILVSRKELEFQILVVASLDHYISVWYQVTWFPTNPATWVLTSQFGLNRQCESYETRFSISQGISPDYFDSEDFALCGLGSWNELWNEEQLYSNSCFMKISIFGYSDIGDRFLILVTSLELDCPMSLLKHPYCDNIKNCHQFSVTNIEIPQFSLMFR